MMFDWLPVDRDTAAMVFGWIPVDWVTATIAAITIAYMYLTWNYDYWKKRGIHYEKPGLFFGNYKDVALVKKNVGTWSQEIYKKNEGHEFVGLYSFRTPVLLLRDLDAIKTVLVKEFSSFDQNAFLVDPELDPLISRSPFFSFGERWRVIRSQLSPTFTSGQLRPLFPLIEKAAKDMDEYLQNNIEKSRPDGLEVKDLFGKFTTDVVASCAFGIEAGSFLDKESEFREMNRKALNPDFLRNILFLIKTFFPSLGALLKIRFLPLEVDKFYRSVVNEVISYRQKNKETRNDILQLLMQLKEKAREAFEAGNTNGKRPLYTEEDVTANAITFITEGYETSSITMSFLAYELAMNPDVQDKVRQELQEAMEKNDGKLNYDIITSLPYLSMVTTESLRMHAPLMAMEKYCTKPCLLPKTSGGALSVEPGTLILIPAQAIQNDPKYYPEPEKFDPERFSEERKDSIPKFAYLAFGEGPRVCIGVRFANAQVKTGIAQILLNYDIRPTARTPKKIVQDVNYFLTAAEGGLWLDFVRRH